MLRPLTLHIGLSKTGTSSIQRTLAGQRAALQALGVYYPQSPGVVNHALLPASLVSDPGRLWAFNPAFWDGMAPCDRLERFTEAWREEMAGLPAWVERCVISSEMISGLLRDNDEVARLADLLRRDFDPIEVVVYLRRQDRHSASAYSQWLRNGILRPPSLPESTWAENWLLDYADLLKRFADNFGQAAVRPRIYERETLRNGDVLDDFLHATGIALNPPADAPSRQSNPSLRFEGQALLLMLARHLSAANGGKLRQSQQWIRLADTLSESLPGRGWRPTRNAARAYVAQFAASNEDVRRTYFPERVSLFSEDFSDLPERADELDMNHVAEGAVTALLHEMTASDLREAKAAMALFRLARRLDDRPLVLAALMRAVALEPGDLQARLKLASLLLDEQSWHAAAEHASAALAIDPTDILAQRLSRRARRGLLGKIPAHEAPRDPVVAPQ